jgi:hypothetical protein
MNDNSILIARESVLKAMSVSLPTRDPRVQETIVLLEKVDPALRDLFYSSDDEIASMLSASRGGEKINEIVIEQARPLTDEEQSKFESEILLAEIFGDYLPSMVAREEVPADPLDDNLNKQFDELVNAVVAETQRGSTKPPTVPGQPEIRRSDNLHPSRPRVKGESIRRLAAIAEESEPSSPFTKFLGSYMVGDKGGMRAGVRTIVTAA